MLQRILLPTDGSPLSERALPFAQTLALAQDAEVTAVRVVEPLVWVGYEPSGYISPEVYQDMVEGIERAASDDLEATAARLRAGGVKVQTELLRGTAASALLNYEEKAQPDLVIMTTHGRTGLVRFALGSIADRMVREGTTPVLLIRPFGPTQSALEKALVPLDGSPIAEEALSMVRTLAGNPLREVHLLRAVPEPEERADAVAYLHDVAQRIRSVQLKVHILTEIDAPNRAIERAAAEVDFVILSTHGRGGLERLRHGSVADRATRHLGAPVLLVRAGTTSASHTEASAAAASA